MRRHVCLEKQGRDQYERRRRRKEKRARREETNLSYGSITDHDLREADG